MKCPACSEVLSRETYEDVPVFRCKKCDGYLINRQKMVLIRGTRGETTEDLEAAAARISRRDQNKTVRCPKCLARPMKRDRIQSSEIYIDSCSVCNVVWFDSGELAQMQLNFETSARGVESLARQVRAAGLDSDGDDEFEQNLASLRKVDSSFSQAFGEIISLVLLIITTLGAAFSFVSPPSVQIWIAPLTSLLGVFLVGRILLYTGRLTQTALLVLAALESGFLIWFLCFN